MLGANQTIYLLAELCGRMYNTEHKYKKEFERYGKAIGFSSMAWV